MGYEYLDISGDAGLRATGATLDEAFESAAEGMYGMITSLNDVKETKEIKTETESPSAEGLLIAWLNELIFRFDAYGFIGKKAHIEELRGNKLRAVVRGEDFDPERHEGKLLIKAATYHNLKIEQKNGMWQFEVIFDI